MIISPRRTSTNDTRRMRGARDVVDDDELADFAGLVELASCAACRAKTRLQNSVHAQDVICTTIDIANRARIL